MAEAMEADAVRNLAFDGEAYGVLCDRLGRCLQRLGIERKALGRDADTAKLFASEGSALKILEALDDPSLSGPHFRGPSWTAWRAFLTAAFGLPMGICLPRAVSPVYGARCGSCCAN